MACEGDHRNKVNQKKRKALHCTTKLFVSVFHRPSRNCEKCCSARDSLAKSPVGFSIETRIQRDIANRANSLVAKYSLLACSTFM